MNGENYINVYRISRCYGGPEEGGWYWNAWECVAAIEADRLSKPEKQEMEKLLKRQYPSLRDLPPHINRPSELGDYEVRIENRKAENRTTEVPHYE